MLKVFFILLLFIFFNLVYVPFVNAYDNYDVKEFLNRREDAWPNWSLTDLKYSNIKNDLIYPSWFEGDWVVTSENVNDSSEEILTYSVNFYRNESGEIIGDRSRNAESIGKAIFGNRLRKVKNDPKSFNNQITYLSENQFIESRITQRTQLNDKDLFFADEFAIQTVHNPEASRINQVEIMSKFYKCNEFNSNINEISNSDICGTQYLSTYGSKVGEKNIKAISQSQYKLTFKHFGKKR